MGLFSPFMDDEDDEQKPPRIARPDSGLGIPPVSLRGVTPKPEPIQQAAKYESVPQPKPDLPLAQPSAPPTPSQQHTDTDRAELGRLTSTGSGITQIKNPWARNSLRGLNIAGEVASALLPQVGSVLRAIPGTEEHHNQLVGRATGRLNEDIKGEQEQAQTAHTQAETGAIPSQIEHTEAETDALGQPKPKEESFKPYPNFTDADGTPLKIEETSGKVLRADGGVPTGFKAAKLGPDKPDNPEQQFIDEYQRTHPGASVAQAQHAFKQNENVSEPGNFMPLYGKDGQVTGAWDPKSGRVIKTPDGTLPGNTAPGHGIEQKAADAKTKEAAPYQQMIDTASQAHELADMAGKGNASADVDLVLTFFKMMRGTGGANIRFTQQEQNLILGARNAGQGLMAIGQKVMGEGQALTPDQRAKMVQVIDMHAEAAKKHLQGGGGQPAVSGQTIRARDPQGQLHEAPAGTALPQGWTQE